MTAPLSRLLIIEDETALADVVQDYPQAAGMAADRRTEGTGADLDEVAQALGVDADALRKTLPEPPRR